MKELWKLKFHEFLKLKLRLSIKIQISWYIHGTRIRVGQLLTEILTIPFSGFHSRAALHDQGTLTSKDCFLSISSNPTESDKRAKLSFSYARDSFDYIFTATYSIFQRHSSKIAISALTYLLVRAEENLLDSSGLLKFSGFFWVDLRVTHTSMS